MDKAVVMAALSAASAAPVGLLVLDVLKLEEDVTEGATKSDVVDFELELKVEVELGWELLVFDAV